MTLTHYILIAAILAMVFGAVSSRDAGDRFVFSSLWFFLLAIAVALAEGQ